MEHAPMRLLLGLWQTGCGEACQTVTAGVRKPELFREESAQDDAVRLGFSEPRNCRIGVATIFLESLYFANPHPG